MQAVRMDKAVDNVDWITDENTKVDMNSLPELPGYHLLILPVSIKKKTKGGQTQATPSTTTQQNH